MGFFSGMISKILSVLGSTFASSGSQGCIAVFFEEPEMPKSMIK